MRLHSVVYTIIALVMLLVGLEKAALLSYVMATESGAELVINIDQEWAEFLLYLAAGLNLIRTYIFLGKAQPQPIH